MSARISLCALSAVGMVLAALSPAGHAYAAPANRPYVYVTSCARSGPVSVAFVFPTTGDLRTMLADRGVAGDPDAIWIDLSLFENGFAAGTYLNAGPFVSIATPGGGFSWYGLLPKTTHFYRLNAHVGHQWVELGAGQFETPDCDPLVAMTCLVKEPNTPDDVGFEFPAAIPVDAAAPHGVVAVDSWLDLSLFDNDFAAGTFVGVDLGYPNPSFRWRGIRPAERHYYRWNVLFADDVWRAQAVGSFLSLPCAGLPETLGPTD